ncbi:MAG: hypothetical protein A3H60_00560 [Candidatus Zambryskibacteria bacterium RIFCSPLOWO2_02_FULL_44_12b]|uniref:DUF2784 domain-containing protein n=1 Tax=Candidatus Zambryskibacteria bacterium RIFCSPLOWO2_02_FULL_44_12b TaxID=1802772 RepID=A0A1G2UN18_9BACT|nr:MAG: hypothetical protein A3H60_00560 [Candidatus Zambryskibacteria bacterium RIFCSPLOWO2_02_FULL_44_12b]
MSYAALANATAVTHISSIIFVIVGLLISFRYKRFRPWEAGILIVVVVLWSYYGNCPLTIIEQYFRDLAGQNANLTSVGFLPYYVNKFLSYNLSSLTVQKFTFFTGGTLFAASIEWLAPVMHMEIFRLRRTLRRLARS